MLILLLCGISFATETNNETNTNTDNTILEKSIQEDVLSITEDTPCYTEDILNEELDYNLSEDLKTLTEENYDEKSIEKQPMKTVSASTENINESGGTHITPEKVITNDTFSVNSINDKSDYDDMTNKNNHSVNKCYSKTIKSNYTDWLFNMGPETAMVGKPTNIYVEILNSNENVNKGSFDYYFDGKYIGNSIVNNNYSNLTFTIPNEGYYWMDFVYRDENNQKTDVNPIKDITVYSNETVFIESNLPDNYPLNTPNTIVLYLKDINGNLLKKTGDVDFTISYPVFQIRGFSTQTSHIGKYKFNNGICKFNFTLKDEYGWSEETPYFDINFHFNYLNSANNKNYTLVHTVKPAYNEEMYLVEGYLPSKVKSGDTLIIPFCGIDNYEDSKLLIYINNKYVGSTEFTNQYDLAEFKYKIPNNYNGILNIYAKRVIKPGFNTSESFSYNMTVCKPTIINGLNISGNPGESVEFKGKILDTKGNLIKSGRIVIKLNGKTIKSNIKLNNTNKFSYSYKIPSNYKHKKYNLTYVYVGNDEYARSESQNILNVMKKSAHIKAGNVSVFAGEKVLFKGKVVDFNNKSVSAGRVVVKLNGRTLNSNVTLNRNGEFTFAYKVPNFTAKKYKLTYVYVENQQYSRMEANNTLTIKNQASKITANKIVARHGSTITLKVKISGAKTGINVVSGKVGFKLNGKTVKVNGKVYIQRIKNGEVVFKYQLPSTLNSGRYNITVTYSGGRNLLGNKVTTSLLTIKS